MTRTGAWLDRLLPAIAFPVFGLLAGTITTFAHRVRVDIAGVELWLGLAGGLAALLLLAMGLRGWLDERLPVIGFGAGALGAVLLLATPGIGHSVVIPGDALGPAGTIWVYGSAAAVALPAIWPKLPPRGARQRGPAPQE